MEFIYDFFEHSRDKFALFFDAFHNIWDQRKRCILVFKIIGLLKNVLECVGIKGLIWRQNTIEETLKFYWKLSHYCQKKDKKKCVTQQHFRPVQCRLLWQTQWHKVADLPLFMFGEVFLKADYFVLTLHSQIVSLNLSGNTHKIIKLESALCFLNCQALVPVPKSQSQLGLGWQ